MTAAPLTDKQQRFVEEYLIDLNATQAAIRAGYSAKTAEQQGSRLLRNVQVQQAVREGQEKRSGRVQLSQDEVLLELRRLYRADLRKVFNADGSLKRLEELDDETAAAIASIDFVTVSKGEGAVEHVTKIRRADKLGALTLAMRHLGLLNDKLDLNVSGGLGDRLAKARERRLAAARKGKGTE
jgi:phage terminase small subunit